MADYISVHSGQQVDKAVNRIVGTTQYSPSDYSGMGRVVLQKNIQEVDGAEKNMLTQDMFYTGGAGSRTPNINTVFVIQYDYTLGENITIPDDCVILFDGGRVSGAYTLTGSDTSIDASLVGIFGTDVSFAGSWNIKEVYPEWFGAKGDDTTNDSLSFLALAAFVNSTNVKKVFIPSKTYKVQDCNIHFSGDVEMYGNGNSSVVHMANSNTCISTGQDEDFTVLDTTITTGDTTIVGKDANGDEVTCTAVASGQITLQVSDASQFEVNSYYIIQDVVDFSFDNSRAYYRQGEIIRVASIDTENNTIKLYNQLYGTYGTDDNFEGYVSRSDRDLFEQRFITCLSSQAHRTRFIKCNLHKVYIHDFKIYSTGSNNATGQGYYSLYINNVIDSRVDGMEVTSIQGSHVAVGIFTAYKSSLTNSRIYTDYSSGSDFYGCCVGHIQHFLVSNCLFHGRKHTLATSKGENTKGSIVSRDFIYERLTFEHHTATVGYKALDVHAGAERYTFRNIDAPTYCCDTGGYYMTIENCRFYYISSMFFNSGLTIRNCEETHTSHTEDERLLYFSNPWHDYSKDVMLIDNLKTVGFFYNAQDPNGTCYRINSFIIRNCNISRGVRLRYNFADNIIIESNKVETDYSYYSAITFYNGRVYREGKPQSTIMIRDNYIRTTGSAPFSIDREVGNHKTDTVYICNNILIGQTVTAIKQAAKCYFLNNYVESAGDGIEIESSDAVVSGNYFSCGGKWLITSIYPSSSHNSIVVEDNNKFSSSTDRTNMQIHSIQECLLPFGSLQQKPTTLSLGNFGYRFYNTTSGMEEIWNGTAWISAASCTYAGVSFAVNPVANSSSTITLDGTVPMHIVTTTVDISSVTLSANPLDGHSCHVVFAASSALDVTITYNSTDRVTPDASDLRLTIPAGGYVEVDFMKANGKVYVRGV